jgi:2-dehydropantoate 2-reductase
MISLLSYAAPLPGETRFLRPGTAYWFPPLAPSPFSGPSERTAAVVAALRAGKLPARRHGNVPRAAAFPTAVLMPYLVALEAAGWSFRALGRGDAIQRGARGARAALAVVAASEGRIPLSARMLARPGLLRLGLWLGRRAMPLPLEVYVKEHFTKVHDQTIDFMTGYLAKGRRAGVNVTALDELLAGIAPRPASERESTASAVQRS